MHCSVTHWQRLDEKNLVAAQSWLINLARSGDKEFRRLALQMIEGARPAENGALVIMGALYPKDRVVRAFLKKKAFEFPVPPDATLIAAVYGLGAHLEYDERLRDKILLEMIRWRAVAWEFVSAASDVFSIWDSIERTGTCTACGMTPGSLLIPKPQV